MMIYLYLAIGFLGGLGSGFALGQLWVLRLMKRGAILPINPFALPMIGDEPSVKTVLENFQTRVLKEPAKLPKGAVLTGPPTTNETSPRV
jgi:hypothetical protein